MATRPHTPTPVLSSSVATQLVEANISLITSFHIAALVEMSARVRERGWLTTDLVRSALIMMEESGEVSAGALQCTRSFATDQDLLDLRIELIQLVSLCYQMAVNVQRTIQERTDK